MSEFLMSFCLLHTFQRRDFCVLGFVQIFDRQQRGGAVPWLLWPSFSKQSAELMKNQREGPSSNN